MRNSGRIDYYAHILAHIFSDEIIEKIHDAGFRKTAIKETLLSQEIAEEFYCDFVYLQMRLLTRFMMQVLE